MPVASLIRGPLDHCMTQKLMLDLQKKRFHLLICSFFSTQRSCFSRRNSTRNHICTLVSPSLPQWCKSRASAGSERVQVQHRACEVVAPPRFRCVPSIHLRAASTQLHLLHFPSYYMDESKGEDTPKYHKAYSGFEIENRVAPLLY